VNIVVVQSDGQQFGLIVDRVSDTQEIVVKPLGKHLKSVPVFAGASVLGDGQVALILDVIGLARETRVFSSDRNRAAQKETIDHSDAQKTRMLLFTLDEEHRVAIDLSTVGRLEKFARNRIERAGAREVVQYRGQIMNLVRLADCLGYGGRDGAEDETLHVVVYSERGRNVGLVVGRIPDIVEEVVQLQTDAARPGVLGRAVIQGRVTEMLDVVGLVRQTEPVDLNAN
jgi:two-component system chemotaxis sensor kinase CheA